MDTRAKILNLEKARELIASFASNGRGVRLAKGWFDILRAEHCRILAAAKDQDHPLVVAVYANNSSRATILDASSRAQLVAALAAVDYVVICDEAELSRLLPSWEPTAAVDAEASIRSNIIDDVLQRYRPA